MKKSIGWVAIHKANPNFMGGHRARCKVYVSRQTAIACQRRWNETDDHVLSRWNIVEVFAEVPEA